jgi:polyphosphate glucokinase
LERQFAELRHGASTPITQVTVGMPGMIRRGRVVFTPHYINTAGPFSAVDPALALKWAGCDIQGVITERLGVPVKVVNDAELHGLGVISGVGSELVLTLGTGLGSAWFDDGVLAPHLELSHAPVRIGEMVLGQGRRPSITFDGFIGDHELRRLGIDHWSDRVLAMVDSLRPVFHWDRLFLGGGNATQIAAWARDRLPDDVVLVPNDAALAGGLRLWSSASGRPTQPQPTSLATSFGETIVF